MVGISPTVASHKLNIIPTARLPSNHPNRGKQLIESRLHQGSEVPQVVSQRGGSSKERRKVASMHGLH